MLHSKGFITNGTLTKNIAKQQLRIENNFWMNKISQN